MGKTRKKQNKYNTRKKVVNQRNRKRKTRGKKGGFIWPFTGSSSSGREINSIEIDSFTLNIKRNNRKQKYTLKNKDIKDGNSNEYSNLFDLTSSKFQNLFRNPNDYLKVQSKAFGQSVYYIAKEDGKYKLKSSKPKSTSSTPAVSSQSSAKVAPMGVSPPSRPSSLSANDNPSTSGISSRLSAKVAPAPSKPPDLSKSPDPSKPPDPSKSPASDSSTPLRTTAPLASPSAHTLSKSPPPPASALSEQSALSERSAPVIGPENKHIK
jgi:hypothetical protein